MGDQTSGGQEVATSHPSTSRGPSSYPVEPSSYLSQTKNHNSSSSRNTRGAAENYYPSSYRDSVDRRNGSFRHPSDDLPNYDEVANRPNTEWGRGRRPGRGGRSRGPNTTFYSNPELAPKARGRVTPFEPSKSRGMSAAEALEANLYIPPHKMAELVEAASESRESETWQKISWDALRKSIYGLINRVSPTNIRAALLELFHENLLRGRGLLTRALLKASLAAPSFAPVYAAVAATVNSALPEVGELLVHRAVAEFLAAFSADDGRRTRAAAEFLAHLVNQSVAHEVIALQVITLLLEHPTGDSVDVVVGFVMSTGATLAELVPTGLTAVFDRLRELMNEAELPPRALHRIEEAFAARKASWKEYPAVPEDLDLVEQDKQIPHELVFADPGAIITADHLDQWRFDKSFLDNEQRWKDVKRELVPGDSDDEDSDESSSGYDSDSESGDGEEEDGEEEEERPASSAPVGEKPVQDIQDLTEAELASLRKTIYLTLVSSLTYEEMGHKLMKIRLPPGGEMEVAKMIMESCGQERTYLKHYGLLATKWCQLKEEHLSAFEEVFFNQYINIYQLETAKMRNVAKFFAHMLATDGLPWTVLSAIVLTEAATTVASRIFVKFLFQELASHMGLEALRKRLQDPQLGPATAGLFPQAPTEDIRFAVNFFSTIGLGGLTLELRERYQALMKEEAAARSAGGKAAKKAAKEAAKKAKKDGGSSSSELSYSSDTYDSYSGYSSYSYSYSYSDGGSSGSDAGRGGGKAKATAMEEDASKKRARSHSRSPSPSAKRARG